jgi:N-acetylglutamate synthase-like GNAT family acetyltransferase
MIVAGVISNAKELTAIAFQSKAFWGYSNELIKSWQADLTVTSKMIEKCCVFKYLIDETIAGFYILNTPEKNTIVLEMLFVLPQFIGKGIGKQLIQHSFKKAKVKKVKSITLLADPNAVAFYKKQGFVTINKKESTIPDRFLPVMKKDLEA